MTRSFYILGSVLLAASCAAAQPTVQVEPTRLQGPRPLQEQTQATAVRDYLQAWQTVGTALQQNNAALLDRDFVGAAKDKLVETIQQQAALGVRTHYQDKAHDIKIAFYSPEGLSLQLTDDVDYDVQILDHEKEQTTQHVHAHYIVVMTPAEVRWRVRVFQAQPE
ncbi:MAG TPA: hypothetical protein VGG85_09435 [Terracidiphilus sp.]